jgi:hypothetical protein
MSAFHVDVILRPERDTLNYAGAKFTITVNVGKGILDVSRRFLSYPG